MSHTSHQEFQLAATAKPCSEIFNDAPVALSKGADFFFAPPPPAKFNRRKAGAECRPRAHETRTCDAAFARQMRRGIYESIIITELCPHEVIPVQDDLWAFAENAF